MDYEEICSRLVREPWNVPLHEIPKLDRWTVARIYFRPTDKNGDPIVVPKPQQAEVATDPHSQFVEWWKSKSNCSEAEIAKLWQQHVTKKNARRKR